MLLCMRTTVDLPDSLMARVKNRTREGNMTFRSLVISALEKTLEEDAEPFTLRDAAVGDSGQETVSADAINQLIDDHRSPEFQP